jgi:hypothetical protein
MPQDYTKRRYIICSLLQNTEAFLCALCFQQMAIHRPTQRIVCVEGFVTSCWKHKDGCLLGCSTV